MDDSEQQENEPEVTGETQEVPREASEDQSEGGPAALAAMLSMLYRNLGIRHMLRATGQWVDPGSMRSKRRGVGVTRKNKSLSKKRRKMAKMSRRINRRHQ